MSAPVSNPRDHPRAAPGRSGRRFCIMAGVVYVCYVCIHLYPTYPTLRQPSYPHSLYNAAGSKKKIFSLLLLLSPYLFHPLLLLFCGPCVPPLLLGFNTLGAYT